MRQSGAGTISESSRKEAGSEFTGLSGYAPRASGAGMILLAYAPFREKLCWVSVIVKAGNMIMAEHPYRFTDSGHAPEFFAHALHDVQVTSGVARFVLVALRRDRHGHMIGEPPFTCVLPLEAVGPAIKLTWEKMPNGVLVPAVGRLVRDMLVH